MTVALAQRRRTALSVDAVVAAARQVLEEEGRDAVAMRPIARRLGVRAPSLYFHVESREDLLLLLRREGEAELEAELAGAAGPDSAARAVAFAEAYVGWALRNPALFALVFYPGPPPTPQAPYIDTLVLTLVHGRAALAVARGLSPGALPAILNKDFKDVIRAMAAGVDGDVMGLGQSLTVLQPLDIVKSGTG